MNITIEVSETVPEDAFGRVQALARRVVVNDVTFQGTTIDVKRARFDTVPACVRDSDDPMRQNLLQLLVEEALRGQAESMFGPL
ncbi:hypothetical protein LJR129_002933 [Acidovorax sp. LjRoot129]|uniref:hypothetical protein n=1 Tax=Acidovorax sp. LjRoot129 TaxID=3342260 RepID=UPI00120F9DB3|nr:MAG: hypothetical protein EON50_06100 [Acidovorax sp.]